MWAPICYKHPIFGILKDVQENMFSKTIFHKISGGDIVSTFSYYLNGLWLLLNAVQKLEKRGCVVRGVQGDESIGGAIIQA